MFEKTSEVSISRAILREFASWFDEYLKSDVIVVGAGPSGLVAARDLAKSGFKTLVVESNNYLGGGFWIGGFLMNTLTFRAPGQEILEELGIPYKEVEKGLFVADGPNACSKLISATCDAGVKILNMAKFDDVVLKKNRVEGVVINWTPVSALPRQITIFGIEVADVPSFGEECTPAVKAAIPDCVNLVIDELNQSPEPAQ